jgi:paraquat-inducible protein B
MKMMEELIATGMKARLEVQSILTSLLYVDLDFIRDQPVILTGLHYNDLPEVPAVPTRVDELMVTVAEIAKKINKMPLENMVKDLADAISDLKLILGSDETQRSRVALADALERTNTLMLKLNKDVPILLKNMDAAAVGLRSTSDETLGLVKDFRSQTVPLVKAANQALENASDTLWNLKELTGDSSDLRDAISQISATSRSLRELTDLLERHPDALLLGRPD